MTERNPPVWMQSGTYDAVDDRMVTGLLSTRGMTAAGGAAGILGGVVPPFDQLNATVAGNNMVVSLSAGIVLVPSSGTNPPGAYICYNEGAKAFTLDIESSGNPRIDVIYAEVEDQTTGGDESVWRFGVKKGSPSASPVNPSLLAGQFPLWAVTVKPAAQNGGVNKIMATQLRDLRLFNVAQGGTWVVKDNTAAPPLAPGRMLYNMDSDHLYVSDGAGWEYFLTYQEWMKIFAALRPKHAAVATGSKSPLTAGSKGNWDPTPAKASGSGSISACSVATRSPSGSFKVSISSYGRVGGASNAGHASIRVLQGATTKFGPSAAWRAISFYNKNWEHHGATFMVTGMPKDTNLTFRMEFMRNGSGDEGAFWSNAYILVEPIL